MTPRFLTASLAATLPVACAAAVSVVLLSPGVEDAASAAARVAAFYALTAWAFAAFPRLRRTDLTLAAIVVAAAAEAVRMGLGRDASLQGLGFDSLGAAAILGPMYVERLRDLSRRHGYVAFSTLRSQDSRLGARRSAGRGRAYPA